MDQVRVDNRAEWSVCAVEIQRLSGTEAICCTLSTEDVETLKRDSRCLFETVVVAASFSSSIYF